MPRRSARPLVVATLLALLPGPLRAQAPLGVEAVVRAALEGGASLALAREERTGAGGRLLASRGAFSATLSSTVEGGRVRTPAVAANGAVGADPTLVSGTYEVGLSKRLRSGPVVRPRVSLSSSRFAEAASPGTGSASVGVDLLVPLWKDRGGAIAAAEERASEAGLAASELSLRHAASEGVLDAVVAYWDYVAALRRAEVLARSEERAERLAEETRVLVEADERPAADLNQLRANVASKRMARMAGEQAVAEARRRLGLAMGLSGAEILRIGEVADDFPDPRGAALDTALEARLVETALARRADLAAQERLEEAEEVRLAAARNDLRPRLDLSLSLGYSGLSTGSGLDLWVAPLYRNVPGPSTAVQLEYAVPVSDAGARGASLQRAALVQQRRILQRELRSEIASGVAVATQALRRGVLAAAEAEQAEALYRRTVDDERQKHQLDAATLFDVILAEDALTSAMLARVAARADHAVALASLRFETGTLVTMEDGEPAVRAADLLRVPEAR